MSTKFILVKVNARLQPMHRHELIEDALEEILSQQKIGQITGGGTGMAKNNEIEYCDVEIEVQDTSTETIEKVKSALEQVGIPKGSQISIPGDDAIRLEVGKLEGLAIYTNGSDLADEVYENCDINFVYSELNRLTQGVGEVYSYWEGPTETALYLYGQSFLEMKNLIKEFTESYPLCERCRILQIA